MSISSALNTKAKVTLPSVEMWGNNMVIQKDPPRSIHTRRIDKVSDTQEITKWIGEDSIDRICENIKVYARGVNPMVSVSYNNYGTNGGQSNQAVGLTSQKSCIQTNQAYLPYRIMRDGAFRPPILRQEDLLPLSRLPRLATQSFTNIDFPNYAKKIMCPDKCTAVFDDRLKCSIRPTAVYKTTQLAEQPYEVKYVMNNPTLKMNVTSGIRTRDVTQRRVQIPEHAIQNTLHTQVVTNIGKNIQINLLQDAGDYTVNINDSNTYSITAPVSGNQKVTYLHKDIALSKNIPVHSSRTNITSNNNNKCISSRSYNLAPSITPGSFFRTGFIPRMERSQENTVSLGRYNITHMANRQLATRTYG